MKRRAAGAGAIAAALGAAGFGCTPGPVDVATIAPASVANGMVAHWTFDETAGATAHDSSGNGRDGNIFGPGWSWTPGRFDGALQLSGADQITVGGGFGFPQATANYTVSAWLYVAAADTEPPVAAVLSNEIPWGVGPPGGWSLSLDSPGPGPTSAGAYGFTYWYGQGGPDEVIEATCACVVVDGWTHLAAVIDAAAGTLTLFVGGHARAQVAIPRGIWPAPGALYMGRWPSQGRILTGTLDDVSIYSRALVPEEITLLATAPAPNPM
jgi:hypothetical protein